MEQEQPGRIGRRLAAIVAADVVGYTRLMHNDEEATHAKLTRLLADAVTPAISEHGGRIVKNTGDGFLAEFPSAVQAVRAAVQFQARIKELTIGDAEDRRIALRVGVNIGDVIVEPHDIFGDGVNIAARLEGIAEPGGICISSSTYDQVRGKAGIEFADLGEQTLKNIDRPVRVYAARPRAYHGNTAQTVMPSYPEAREPLSRPDKPSITVLPFHNLSGDPEQEYFADGIVEDVLITLSKIPELFVIARDSSFVFKGQARDIREIGRKLGARYVLEGSVRKAGNRVRLAAQLIDSLNGAHVWADRFEGDLDDVFDLQDRITQDIVAALEVRLTLGEEARVWRKRSGSPLVYEHYLKGRALYVNFAKHTHVQARSELERALAINPAFAPALELLGFVLTDQVRFGWETGEAATYESALECAARALAVDPNSSEAYVATGYTRLFQRRHDDALAAGEKAIALGPSSADAYHITGMIHGYAGDFRNAAQYEEQAQRLSPLRRNQSMVDEARARFHLGDLVTALDIASRVLIEKPRWLTAQTVLVAALWNLGREDEARVTVGKILANHPNLTARRWAQGLPYRHQKDLDALVTPLRLAGLPE
jgi:TolB-like protein/class 3 adenylate cyclase/Flp pilus assembly protein TadD